MVALVWLSFVQLCIQLWDEMLTPLLEEPPCSLGSPLVYPSGGLRQGEESSPNCGSAPQPLYITAHTEHGNILESYVGLKGLGPLRLLLAQPANQGPAKPAYGPRGSISSPL